jgi:sugar phosphate isomerase/epimerase
MGDAVVLPLSITSDYQCDWGSPEPCLRRIAKAGFTHIHWCHQWKTDFIYCDAELAQIGEWMREYGLSLCDIHASSGVEKRWMSPVEYERLAGIELVKNRIDMAARLGSNVIIMHIEQIPDVPEEVGPYWTRVCSTLDTLEPYALEKGVRIALENGKLPTIREILKKYSPDFLGLCYDCGHGNLDVGGIDDFETLIHRLLAVHLHDNDGLKDWHRPVYSGTIDWPQLTTLIAKSSYKKPPSMELNMNNTDFKDEDEYLSEMFAIGQRLAHSLEEERKRVSAC